MGRIEGNVGVAFALVIGAGLATALGSAVVFVPRLVKLASRRTLAASLGLSAGVMIYVSFIEIFQKSITGFSDAGFDHDKAYIYASVSLFSGVAFMIVLNYVVTSLLGGHHHHNDHYEIETRPNQGRETKDTISDKDEAVNMSDIGDDEAEDDNMVEQIQPTCCASDPGKDLLKINAMSNEIEEYEAYNQHTWEGKTKIRSVVQCSSRDEESSDSHQCNDQNDEPSTTSETKHDTHKLMSMSMNTAIAIALHNFPEGLATFVATLEDPHVGAVLAAAIAIHNVPEGLCVALPLYYSTGQRWRAFMWGTLSGLSEIVAAVLGYAVLANSFSDTLYGVLFGMVSGMMIIISFRELLPTAHRYDPEDTVVSYSFVAGMAIISASLILFLV